MRRAYAAGGAVATGAGLVILTAELARVAITTLGPPALPYRLHLPMVGYQAPKPTATLPPAVQQPYGFAGTRHGHARVTGGQGGPMVWASGPRELAELLATPGRRTVRATGAMNLRGELLVTSDKTLEGRNLVLTGEGIRIYQAGNVIVRNVTVRDCREDAIAVRESRDIWLDGLDLSACGDGLIDITRGSQEVTVSNAHLHDHAKGSLIGEVDHLEGGLSTNVTFWRVWFDGVRYRHPKLRWGYVHMANVVVDGWEGEAIDVSTGGQLYIQDSLFVPRTGDERFTIRVNWPDARPGRATVLGLGVSTPSAIVTEGQQDVLPPPYAHSWSRRLTGGVVDWIRAAGPTE